MKVTCSCKKSECKQEIWFDSDGHILWHSGRDGDLHAFYMDANTCITLIQELKKAITAMANKD